MAEGRGAKGPGRRPRVVHVEHRGTGMFREVRHSVDATTPEGGEAIAEYFERLAAESQNWRTALGFVQRAINHNLPHVKANRPRDGWAAFDDPEWFIEELNHLWRLIEAAEASAHAPSMVRHAFLLGARYAQLIVKLGAEKDWGRGKANREATRRGGEATRKNLDPERVAAMAEVLARKPKLSIARAATLVAQRRGESVETVRRAWYRAKLGTR